MQTQMELQMIFYLIAVAKAKNLLKKQSNILINKEMLNVATISLNIYGTHGYIIARTYP